MRYRALAAGDMTFGAGGRNYLTDSPKAVAQAVETRLWLLRGEWFLDTADGTDWAGKVLGKGTLRLADIEIRRRILETPNVSGITAYSSTFNGETRALSIAATISTLFGAADIKVTL